MGWITHIASLLGCLRIDYIGWTRCILFHDKPPKQGLILLSLELNGGISHCAQSTYIANYMPLLWSKQSQLWNSWIGASAHYTEEFEAEEYWIVFRLSASSESRQEVISPLQNLPACHKWSHYNFLALVFFTQGKGEQLEVDQSNILPLHFVHISIQHFLEL